VRVRRLGSRAVLAIVSTLSALVLCEGLVRRFAPQDLKGQIFEFAPRGYKVHRSEGTAIHEAAGFRVTYRFTPPHLRGAPAPPGARRILVLGDSFTAGWLLAEDETYVGRLQHALDATFGSGRVALLNAGTMGAGTADQVAFLEDFGAEVAPAGVLDVVGLDDFGRAERSGLYRLASPDSLDLVAAASRRKTLVDAIVTSRTYRLLAEHSHLVQLVRTAAWRLAPRLGNPNAAGLAEMATADESGRPAVTESQARLARALFRRMQAWCDAHGARFAVMNNGWRRYDWLVATLKGDGISVFDATPAVRPVVDASPQAFTLPDGHPNPRGAAVIADALWPFLRTFVLENGLAAPAGAISRAAP
jgi:lysophospholipase L1-like esterase